MIRRISNALSWPFRWAGRRWRRLAFLGVLATWIVYMPMHMHFPECRDTRYWNSPVYFSPHLSDEYREVIRSAYKSFGVPFIELGDVIVEPLIDWTDFDTRNIQKPWWERVLFSGGDMWINVKSGAVMSVARTYTHGNDDPLISPLARAYLATYPMSSEEDVPKEEKHRRYCALVEAVANGQD